MAEKKRAEVSFEKALEELEAIVEKLENPETTLEESIALYERGRRLGRECGERLTQLEKRVQLVKEAADGTLQTAPFDAPEGAAEA